MPSGAIQQIRGQPRARRLDAAFRSPAPIGALRQPTVAGSTFPAYLFAPFRAPLVPVRFADSTYRNPFEISATARHPRTRCTSRLTKLPCRSPPSLPIRNYQGFPSPDLLPDRRAQPFAAQASSPWCPARSSFAPQQPLVIGIGRRIIVPDSLLSTRLEIGRAHV